MTQMFHTHTFSNYLLSTTKRNDAKSTASFWDHIIDHKNIGRYSISQYSENIISRSYNISQSVVFT